MPKISFLIRAQVGFKTFFMKGKFRFYQQKRQFFIFLLVAFIISAFAPFRVLAQSGQNANSYFRNTERIARLLEQAGAQTADTAKKIVFIYVTNPENNYYERLLEEINQNKKAQYLLNKYFLCKQIHKQDLEHELDFEEAYNAPLPSFLFVSSDRVLVHEAYGQQHIRKFTDLLLETLNLAHISVPTLTPLLTRDYKKLSLPEMDGLYAEQNREPEFLFYYACKLQENSRNFNDIANLYCQICKNETGLCNINMYNTAILRFSTNILSEALTLLINNRDLQESIARDMYTQKVTDALLASADTCAYRRDQNLFQQTLNLLHQAKLPNEEIVLFIITQQYYKGLDDLSQFFEYTKEFLTNKNNYGRVDAAIITNICQVFADKGQKNEWNIAIVWIEPIAKEKPIFENIYVQAQILEKLKRNKDAYNRYELALNLLKNKTPNVNIENTELFKSVTINKNRLGELLLENNE